MTKYQLYQVVGFPDGGPDKTRTCDLRFRKPLLYPAELRDPRPLFYFISRHFESVGGRECNALGTKEISDF
jgi:hypothetical protein